MLNITTKSRHFLPQDLVIETWQDIEPFAREIEAREITSLDEYQKLLSDYNEFDAVTADDYWWRFVLQTRDSANQQVKESFEYFTQHITPELDSWREKVNKKLVNSPFAKQVTEIGYSLALKKLQTQINLFRKENLALKSREEELISQSGALRGAMTVQLDGQEMTLQAASNRLFWIDRDKREEAWHIIAERQYQDHDALSKIFAELVQIRTQMARNAGFDNYRDYMFQVYNRYDYTPEDCYTFHESIKQYATPLLEKIQQEKAQSLGLDTFRPWDRNADAKKREPIKAFQNVEDLLDKSLQVFGNLDSVFHDTLLLMRERGNLDLDSRKGKHPGGYMQTFLQSKVPFVFGNFTQQESDIITLVHETGHAVHDILVRDLRLNLYRIYPMETAELASMAMELLSMDQWHLYFSNPEELKRAKRTLLERVISVLPQVAQLDAFQHAVYLKPEDQDRDKIWQKIQKPLAGHVMDWSGLEKFESASWQNKSHPFDVPFYYVEYGMAQLGAIQVWRNYKQNPQKAIEQYKQGLSLGSTASIPEVYEAAGVKFDFSANMVKELMEFVQDELDSLS